MTPDAVQSPPELENQYTTDRALASYLRRALPEDVLRTVRPELEEMGRLAANELYELHLDDLDNEPTLERWGAWGDRLDRIELTDVWKRAEEIAAKRGVVATAYEQDYGPYSRVVQMALAYLFIPSTDMYGCPLAMTDGAARTLLDSGNEPLIDEAVPHLTAREAQHFWTSGQWMTEVAGGSDVSGTRTTARRDSNGAWTLHGRKWFTSAVTANMALALARPEGNPEGSEGIALFYVPVRDGDTLADGIYVNRLKDKLGTRKLPTAELQLDGARAHLVTETPRRGTRHIAPMLRVTRTWNSVTAVAYVRRGLALARDYAHKRKAFGAPIIDHPLHRETLADLQARLEGMLHLTFRVVELMGRFETGNASEGEKSLLRLLTPITKLTTGKQAITGTSEAIEAFGGAGYVEDTGLPPLLRDAQVLPIWEGTTNVLALDLLRAIKEIGGLGSLRTEIDQCLEDITDSALREIAQPAVEALDSAAHWLNEAGSREEKALQAGARRFALTVGDALELLYTARHAQWALTQEDDPRPAAAARRQTHPRINRIGDFDPSNTWTLAAEENPDDQSSRLASPNPEPQADRDLERSTERTSSDREPRTE